MSDYKPQRTFTASVGDPSTDLAGPEALEHDLDELAKMFNPDAVHDDETPGGIGPGNLNFNPYNSPNFTGVPKSPTAAKGTATDQIATTAFVHNAKDVFVAIKHMTSGQAIGAAIAADKAVFAIDGSYNRVYSFAGLKSIGGTNYYVFQSEDSIIDEYGNGYIDSLLCKTTGPNWYTGPQYVIAGANWVSALLAAKAYIDSPTFTGNPKAPTPSDDSSNKSITTREYVDGKDAKIRTFFAIYGASTFEELQNAIDFVRPIVIVKPTELYKHYTVVNFYKYDDNTMLFVTISYESISSDGSLAGLNVTVFKVAKSGSSTIWSSKLNSFDNSEYSVFVDEDDNNKRYLYRFYARDGHPAISLSEE